MLGKTWIFALCVWAVPFAHAQKPATKAAAELSSVKKVPAPGWAAKLVGDSGESFDVVADGKPLELRITARAISEARKNFEWSARYANRTPTQVRGQFAKLVADLEEAKAELFETVKEREGVEKEIAFARKEGGEANELKSLAADLRAAQKSESQAISRHDRLVGKIRELTGEPGRLFLVPGKKIEDAVESFSGAKFFADTAIVEFRSPRGRHRYTVQFCQDPQGCPHARLIVALAPQCGPDLWKSAINFERLSANAKTAKLPSEAQLFTGTLCSPAK